MIKTLYRTLSDVLNKRHLHLIGSLDYASRAKRLELNRLDYIRVSTLELCAEEIYRNGVSGNVAELGVYKGDFAKDLNAVFPDRKLYLFDTFQGFDRRDVDIEVAKGFSQGNQNFGDTNVQHVLSKMSRRENCIVRKGFFPETAQGVDDTFCFVSIDADLYKPILAGLEFFYPRLAPGGYIFVHDFNNDQYTGSREAVLAYCRQHRLGYLPIADIGGTVVLYK